MKKVNIFLLSILAICSAFVMMSPKSYQSSYAVGNEVSGTFTAPMTYNYIGFSHSASGSGSSLTITDVSSNATNYGFYFYFNYILTLNGSDIVFSFKDNSYYYEMGTNNIFSSLTSDSGFYGVNCSDSVSFNIVYDSAYFFDDVVFWFNDLSDGQFNCVVDTMKVDCVPVVSSGVVSSDVPSNITFSNFVNIPSQSQNVLFYYLRHILTDSNGNSIQVCYLTALDVPVDETYYFDISHLSDNDYFQAGYDKGKQDGETDGYARGKRDGTIEGEYAGYNRGILEANDYSFLGLIGSVIDAPIAAFRGLLNFEVFGVDLAPFMLGLFSIALVLIILRKMKGI